MSGQPGVNPTRVLVADRKSDRAEWEALVAQSPAGDPYYRPGYCAAYSVGTASSSIALLIEGSFPVLLPLLLQPLSGLPFQHDVRGFDAITPYGYGGIMPLRHAQPPTATDAGSILDCLRAWCAGTGVAYCYLRLHPMFEQERWFEGLPARSDFVVKRRGETSLIKLGAWDSEEDSIAGMAKGRRTDLRFARRSLTGSSISPGHPHYAKQLEQFQSLYAATMRRRAAADFFFFSDRYFRALSQGLDGSLCLSLAWLGDRLVGAAMFFAGRRFAHYHLSCTDEEGLKHKAPTLVLNEGARWARAQGCESIHLGGGTSDQDSLWSFKASFGGLSAAYWTATLAVDAEAVRRLTEERERVFGPPNRNFVPYR